MTVGGNPLNVAADSSSVGMQIGTAEVVNIHKTTYQYAGDDPDRQFTMAKKLLEARAHVKALEIMQDLRARGHGSTELAYHSALAVLSSRPFDQLDSVDLDRLRQASELARKYPPDSWSQALEVVTGLVDCLTEQERRDGSPDTDHLDAVFAGLDQLHERRRLEIGRHLEGIVVGAVQRRLDDRRRREIDIHRMNGRRSERVPLFFEADPVRPRLRHTDPPAVDARHWAALGGAVMLAVAGIALTLSAAAAGSGAAAVLIAALELIGAAAGLAAGARFLHARALAGRWRRPPAEDPDDAPSPIGLLATVRFAEVRWRNPDDQTRFQLAATHYRTRLISALRELYEADAPAEAPASGVDWLIRWHAWRAARAWQAGDLVRHREPTPAGPAAALVLALTTLTASAALAVAEVIRQEELRRLVPVAGGTAALIIAVRLFVAAVAVYSEPRRFRREADEHVDLLSQERAGHDAEVRRLRQRPEDHEMAEWLDYDKDVVRLRAMATWGLTSNDVISHVVLTEAAPNARRARLIGGPIRYSVCTVRLFLLTFNGVRQVDVQIDMASGAENKERRRAFRYEAIASVEIEEPTVRRYGRRQVATPVIATANGVRHPVIRQSLHLTLLNNDKVDIKADYASFLTGSADDSEALELELEASGALSTLRTLETVAGEGREWIRREKERTRRTATEYERTQRRATE